MTGPARHVRRRHRPGIVPKLAGWMLLVSVALAGAGSAHAGALPADRCLDHGEDGLVRYTCAAPATVAFCLFSYTMEPQAPEAAARLAQAPLCRPSELMHHPCHLGGPGTCDHAKAQAGRLGIAGMDAVWRVCEGTGDVPRYEGRGEFACADDSRSAGTLTLQETAPPAEGPPDAGRDAGFSKDDVLEAQELLAASGYDPGPADGLWGPRTGRAVQSFLADAGLSLADILTMQALRALRGAAGDERSRAPDGTVPSMREPVSGADDAGFSAVDVLEAQLALAKLGYDPGPADGYWGPMTGEAVQSFLAGAGLSLADVLAMRTLGAVQDAASSGRAGDTPKVSRQSRADPTAAPPEPGAAPEGLADTGPPQPQCAEMPRPSACWMEFENIAGCYMWLEKVGPEVTVLSAAWHGACSGGKASGPGTRQVKVRFLIDGESLEGEGLESGTFADGKAHGRWVSLDDGGGMRTVTDYVDGEVQRIEVRDTGTGSCVVSNFDRGTFLNSHAC